MANLAGASRSLTAILLVFDELMIILGLASVLSADNGTKWGWFALACVAFVPILYLVLVDFQKYKRQEVSVAYNAHAVYLSVLWFLYPIVVGLGTTGETISSDAETVWITNTGYRCEGCVRLHSAVAVPYIAAVSVRDWLADYPASLPRHAEYDERDAEGLDPATNQTYPDQKGSGCGRTQLDRGE